MKKLILFLVMYINIFAIDIKYPTGYTQYSIDLTKYNSANSFIKDFSKLFNGAINDSLFGFYIKIEYIDSFYKEFSEWCDTFVFIELSKKYCKKFNVRMTYVYINDNDIRIYFVKN